MDMYKFAAQKKLRFPSTKGQLVVEQLFDLPLKSTNNFDLNTVAKTISNDLKTTGEENFVGDTTLDPHKEMLEVALEIVKDVIKVKQEENAARLNKLKKAEERKKILNAIAAKKDQQLTTASLEELQQKLDALDG